MVVLLAVFHPVTCEDPIRCSRYQTDKTSQITRVPNMTANLSAGIRPVGKSFGTNGLSKRILLSQSCIQAPQCTNPRHYFHRCSSFCSCRSRSAAIAALTSNGSSALASREIEVPMRDYEQTYLAARYFRANGIRNLGMFVRL